MDLKKIAIIIPFYNEQKNLIFFIKEWEKLLFKNKKLKQILIFYFFNDGSTDKSVQVIKKYAKKLKFKIVEKKNTGHGDTCRFAYYFIIKNKKNVSHLLQIDSDNQCNPNYVIKFLNLLNLKKYKYIFGFRKYREDGFLRVIFSRVLSVSLYLKTSLYIKDLNSPYRLMEAKSLKNILFKIKKNKKYKNIKLFNCILSLEISKKYNINWVDITFRERKFGNSKFNLISMLKMYCNFLFKV